MQYGYKAEEIIGKKSVILYPKGKARLEKDILNKVSKGIVIESFETKRVKKNGDEITVLLTVSPVKDKDENIIGVSVISKDITALKEAEKRQSVLASIVTSSEDAIITIDLEGIITSWNESAHKLYGFKAEEVIGRMIYAIIPPEKTAEEDYVIHEVEEKQATIHLETIRKAKDGSERDVSLIVSPIKNKDGKVYGISKIARDIRDRKRLEYELYEKNIKLEQINKTLSEFAYGVSHDLKAPLRGINLYATLLEEDFGHCIGKDGLELVNKISNQVKSMTDLIEGILSYSKSAEFDDKREIDMNELIRKITTSISIPPYIQIVVKNKFPKLYIQETLIHQIFQNLIDNAIKFIDKPKGKIVFGYKKSEKELIFCVSDNGIGIESKNYEKIFQLFQTLNPKDKYGGGTGIGLSIVKKSVDVLKGRIWLESKAGKGTTFYIALSDSYKYL